MAQTFNDNISINILVAQPDS